MNQTQAHYGIWVRATIRNVQSVAVPAFYLSYTECHRQNNLNKTASLFILMDVVLSNISCTARNVSINSVMHNTSKEGSNFVIFVACKY